MIELIPSLKELLSTKDDSQKEPVAEDEEEVEEKDENERILLEKEDDSKSIDDEEDEDDEDDEEEIIEDSLDHYNTLFDSIETSVSDSRINDTELHEIEVAKAFSDRYSSYLKK